MTKTELIERYRNCYANDNHLDMAVEQGILIKEEAEVLKTERYNEGGIVKREEVEEMKTQLQEMEKKTAESDMAILGLMDTILKLQGGNDNV